MANVVGKSGGTPAMSSKVGSKNSQTAGLSISAVKSTLKEVVAQRESLDKNLNNLHDHILELNKQYWYGGKGADNWYKLANNNYVNQIKFRNKLVKLEEQLRHYINGYQKIF